MPAKQIILNVTNTTSLRASFSILGGDQDPNRHNINAYTQYLYDLVIPNWANISSFALEYKVTGTATFSIASGITNNTLQGFLYTLNNLNIGLFNIQQLSANNYLLYTFNDYATFGVLTLT